MAVEGVNAQQPQAVWVRQYAKTAAHGDNYIIITYLEPAVLQKKFNALIACSGKRYAPSVALHEEVTAPVMEAYARAIENHSNPQAAKEAYAKLFSCFLQLHSLLCRNGQDALGYELNKHGLSLSLKGGEDQVCFFDVAASRLPEGTLADLVGKELVHRYTEYKCTENSVGSAAARERYQAIIEEHLVILNSYNNPRVFYDTDVGIILENCLALTSKLPGELRQFVGISTLNMRKSQFIVTISGVTILRFQDVTDETIRSQFILFVLQSDKAATESSIQSDLKSLREADSLRKKIALWNQMRMKLPKHRQGSMWLKLDQTKYDIYILECELKFNSYNLNELKVTLFRFQENAETGMVSLSDPYLAYLQATSANLIKSEDREKNTQTVRQEIKLLTQRIEQAAATADDIKFFCKELEELHVRAGKACNYKELEAVFDLAWARVTEAKVQQLTRAENTAAVGRQGLQQSKMGAEFC